VGSCVLRYLQLVLCYVIRGVWYYAPPVLPSVLRMARVPEVLQTRQRIRVDGRMYGFTDERECTGV
jgi:hypothetical protein